jgi:hypothetical protein
MTPLTTKEQYNAASNWIRFLRGYGPVPRNENMYDEFIRRSAKRLGVAPLDFSHPAHEQVLDAICGGAPTSVVLTGTAGDGKTYLCRQVWEAVGGDLVAWSSPDPWLSTVVPKSGRQLHVIRDLSAWAPQRGAEWEPKREALLQTFARAILGVDQVADLFLIAANDGQLMDSWHRLSATPERLRVGDVLESLLVDDRQTASGVALRFFNLSRRSSAELFDLSVGALLTHPGWEGCRRLNAGPGEFFGPGCPIRHNLELLDSDLVRRRLRELLALCDYNRLHIPIRQVLLLLSNVLLGHADARDGLLTAEDVPRIIRSGTVAGASLYNNVFGGNLSETRRESRLVFDALGRFGIGQETSNRIDNILIFGNSDEILRPYFDCFLAADRFYGADPSFRAAQREYIEGADEDEARSAGFLEQLVGQRRGLFFKIPEAEADDLKLWQLTVFSYAGEYLNRVVARLERGERVERPILSRLTRGLNRVFTGLLVSDDRELLLATSLTVSEGRVSRLLEDRVSVEPRRGDRIDMVRGAGGVPCLRVTVGGATSAELALHLTRYEFLSRVADGALPSSFSKECYEDMLAFKSCLLAVLIASRHAEEQRRALAFQLLEVDEGGKASVTDLEVRSV